MGFGGGRMRVVVVVLFKIRDVVVEEFEIVVVEVFHFEEKQRARLYETENARKSGKSKSFWAE